MAEPVKQIAITRSQVVLVHVAKNKLAKTQGFSDDDYRDLLHTHFGVRSCKDLTKPQANQLIILFEKLGWDREVAPASATHKRRDRAGVVDKSRKAEPPPDPGAPIGTEQQHVVCQLFLFLDWGKSGQHTFTRRVLHDKFGRSKPWPQTRSDGQKIIYALMHVAKEKLLQAVEALDPSALTAWERGFIYDNEHAALPDLRRMVNAKGKRGQRTLPHCSLTKLFEILEKRG